MRIGHVGPRTLPKCNIRGTRLVLNLVSIMTAALLEPLPLKNSSPATTPSWGLLFHMPLRWPVGSGGGGSDDVGVAADTDPRTLGVYKSRTVR